MEIELGGGGDVLEVVNGMDFVQNWGKLCSLGIAVMNHQGPYHFSWQEFQAFKKDFFANYSYLFSFITILEFARNILTSRNILL